MLSIVAGLLMIWVGFSIFWKALRDDWRRWNHKPDPKELSKLGRAFLLPAEIGFRLLHLTVYALIAIWNGLMYVPDSTNTSETGDNTDR